MSKRLRVISEDEYQRLEKKSKPTLHAQNHFLEETTQNASEIINAKEIPDDIKIHLYSGIMKNVKKQIEEIINKPIAVKLNVENQETNLQKNNNPNISELIIDAKGLKDDHSFVAKAPATYKPKYFEILRALRKHPDLIKWDSIGRVTFFKNEYEPETNLHDLLNYSVRDMKWQGNPGGINRFLNVVKLANVPVTNFSKKIREDLMKRVIPLRETATTSFIQPHEDPFKNWSSLSTPETTMESSVLFKTPPEEHEQNQKNVTVRKRRDKNKHNKSS